MLSLIWLFHIVHTRPFNLTTYTTTAVNSHTHAGAYVSEGLSVAYLSVFSGSISRAGSLVGRVCTIILRLFVDAKVFPASAELCLQPVCPFLRKLEFLQ